MARKQFNDGQEIIYQDHNDAQALRERELYDRVLYELLGRTTDGFIYGGLRVSRNSATQVAVAPGIGFQNDGTQVSPEPTKRLIYLAASSNQNLAAADATNPRIDIVCVKADRAASLNESRRYRAVVGGVPGAQNFDVENDWQAAIQVVTGTPAGSPVAPATPAGYIRIASLLVTAVTGLGTSGVTDERAILRPLGQWDAIVGSSALCTHTSLKDAVASVSAGARILIAEDVALTATVSLNKANLLIEGKPGATLSGAGTGLTIDAAGVRIRGLRFSGFTTAISITDTFNNNFVMECRFASSLTNDVVDNNATPNNLIAMNISE